MHVSVVSVSTFYPFGYHGHYLFLISIFDFIFTFNPLEHGRYCWIYRFILLCRYQQWIKQQITILILYDTSNGHWTVITVTMIKVFYLGGYRYTSLIIIMFTVKLKQTAKNIFEISLNIHFQVSILQHIGWTTMQFIYNLLLICMLRAFCL